MLLVNNLIILNTHRLAFVMIQMPCEFQYKRVEFERTFHNLQALININCETGLALKKNIALTTLLVDDQVVLE